MDTITDRPNTNLSAAVDRALEISIEHGARAAARFLLDHGAAFAFVVRVLA